MTIIITGCAGFIGSHVVDKLLDMEKNVVGIDNFDPFYDQPIKMKNIHHNLDNENFTFYRADIREKARMEKIFNNDEIDTMIHLAARAGVRPSIQDPLLYQDVNIRGTMNLLEISREHGIKNFIFGSSSSVYGINEKIPFGEDDPVDKAISPYAATKKACETFCYTYHHLYGIPITSLRFFTVYGPRQRPEMAIHKFTRSIDEGKIIEMYGDGKSRRDYTYISDIVNGIIAAVNKKLGYEIINLGNSNVVELRYLIQLIEENLGKSARIQKMPDQPGDVPVTYADISKAQMLLGYEPEVRIEQGIENFVNWYKDVAR
ncbi:MAG: UDP-glucose 4-epimerase [Candidatus Methanoperedens nitroreducens]|uniref:UDP-glucose 4-epimerase n=1 Tax=Candidatus Methanoperedens nitratireducens TaxID=1392998 RepID=A0A0P8AFF9_9EURY|nr:GDP-mannose 4,6-dehydratase [Candidatus Methanoperedens sp. BLZ2]KAB2945343.1 MAG: NAD-dependent epimerase/dehydratase family protein [Candidatus Methanoperedens sp.]KPQ43033.1 MAG: UDP-glucose 4-epimerase [Candidatus Methanoperedens sp. BLZ1]MBZ0176548.1 GDP-mannose 4,6-dehydratase [Candidatus Methanoperedens nitroreducens]CAG0950902.1 UDP-glucuronate 4-epimerase [Methanosarcinales archaeon]MCX9077866.1 GDP-mannose 4,6-dehydratase [Candidatus Methanoperedens sp.]